DTIIANIGSKKIDETEIQPATTSDTYGDIIEGGSASIGTKRKNVRRTECSGELESLTGTRNPVVELESLERYKSECVKLAAELEKKKVECTTLQGKLAEVDTRMTAAVTDSTECWRKMLCDLESRLLRMEKEKSTFGGLESRVLNLENIVTRMDNENSTVAGSVESRILKLESLVMRSKKPFVNVVSDDW
ncbi:hypothetical protein MKW94_015465, partial [Papaver nudicaule]|nr:hypothetical protein [Papaver nudicaule]